MFLKIDIMQKKAKFEILYRQHYGPINKFCSRFVDGRESALDIAQEVFIKLYERMDMGGEEVENARAWLYKVAGNLCLNSLNTKKRHSEIKGLIKIQSIENETPENILIRDEKIASVKKAVGQLKPKSRMLIMMYQDGLSYKEMSEATGITINSVGKTLWRVIEKISETVKTEENEQ